MTRLRLHDRFVPMTEVTRIIRSPRRLRALSFLGVSR